MSKKFRIFHLSDIHFHENYNSKGPAHCHSLRCLQKIEEVFADNLPDLLVVTGDLTNMGDSNSFNRIRQWLKDRINVDANFYGLKTESLGIPCIFVPGNHDAFNTSTRGKIYQRWQSSLDNYYTAFPEYYLGENGVQFHWFSRGNVKLFVCSVDSCYLGDPQLELSSGVPSFSKIAKGNISRKQAAEIIKLYDRGLRGELQDTLENPISRADFLSSFKLMAIHHYLFEPDGVREEQMLHFRNKHTVFQNIAMADFDALICGHKHYSEQKTIRYIDHFEPRGRLRYAFNHVRRALGIDSLPLNEVETQGISLRRTFRVLLSLMYYTRGGRNGLTTEGTEEIIGILEKCLHDKTVAKSEVIRCLRQNRIGQSGLLWEREELVDLYNLIRQRFTKGQMQLLMEASDSLKQVMRKLARRPFIHIMAGSSAKYSEKSEKRRSFNIYDLSFNNDDYSYVFETTRFLWKSHDTANNCDLGHFEPEKLAPFVMPFSRIL